MKTEITTHPITAYTCGRNRCKQVHDDPQRAIDCCLPLGHTMHQCTTCGTLYKKPTRCWHLPEKIGISVKKILDETATPQMIINTDPPSIKLCGESTWAILPLNKKELDQVMKQLNNIVEQVVERKNKSDSAD